MTQPLVFYLSSMFDVKALYNRYYPEGEALTTLVWNHCKQVADLAHDIAVTHPHLDIDLDFLYEAAMLHDIGVYATHAPSILCMGSEPYLRHGIIGAELLRAEGMEAHARVCERHIGVGLTATDIATQQLPLPEQDMLPETMEEKLICYADNYFSKSHPTHMRTYTQVRNGVARFGEENLMRFDELATLFGRINDI